MKKRNNIHAGKRESFWKIFGRSSIAAIILTALFCLFLREFVSFFIYDMIFSPMINENISHLQSRISLADSTDREEEIQAQLCRYTYFEGGIEQNWFPTITSSLDGNTAFSAILDKNDKVVMDNRVMFLSDLIFEKGKEAGNGTYRCDFNGMDIPELKEIYKEYYNPGGYRGAWFKLNSAVVNKETKEFYPTELEVHVYRIDKKSYLSEEEFTKTYTPDPGDFEGELIEFAGLSENGAKEKYPVAAITGFWGADEEAVKAIDDFIAGETTDDTSQYNSYFQESSDKLSYQRRSTIYIGGEEHTLEVRFFADKWSYGTKKFVILGTVCAFCVLMLIAFLRSWRKNVINKARYAFEDYQKSLTNNLAHDIKTPLAAIGGYAENLLEECGSEKERKYLTAIMENVSYTDSLVSRTLELNRSFDAGKLSPTEFSVRELAEETAEKYMVRLEEQDTELHIDGDGQLRTDRDMFLTAVENLISNAVKYTRPGGRIDIKADGKHLTITNDVAAKVDTTDLTMPFVKGDKARSDRSSGGLGLSIAKQSLGRLGYSLDISCTDTKFTARIKY